MAEGRKIQIQDYRANERIKASTVRLIGSDGAQVGIVSREQALERARAEHLDLIEVAPNADPPVCRILDFGKFKYRQKKKRSQKRHRSHVKEIRIGLNTAEHDLNFKAERVRKFLAEGNKVAVTMRLTRREKAHGDLAVQHMAEFGQRFEDIAKFEKTATQERASLVSMLLVPR